MIAYIEVSIDTNGRMINQKPEYDKMLNDKVTLQSDENVVSGQVKQ